MITSLFSHINNHKNKQRKCSRKFYGFWFWGIWGGEGETWGIQVLGSPKLKAGGGGGGGWEREGIWGTQVVGSPKLNGGERGGKKWDGGVGGNGGSDGNGKGSEGNGMDDGKGVMGGRGIDGKGGNPYGGR